MKKKHFLIALATSFLLIGCGQNTSQPNTNTPNSSTTTNQINTSNQQTIENSTTANNDIANNTTTTDDYTIDNPSDYIILALPIDETNHMPVGMYLSDDKQLGATVELPNDTNTQNLDLVLGPPESVTTVDLTDAEGFFKIRMHNMTSKPLSVTIEDVTIGEGKYALIQNIPPSHVTTIYNKIPWPTGQYHIQFVVNEGKAYASVETDHNLNGFLVEEDNETITINGQAIPIEEEVLESQSIE